MARIVEHEPVPFEGFGPQLLEFYQGLQVDNSKAYWLAHKAQYDVQIAGPLNALADELEPGFGHAKVFRPYRDVRFSADKTPYKEHASLGFFGGGGGGGGGGGSRGGGGGVGGLYVQISPEGLLLAGGMYDPARDQLERFRDLQDDPKATLSLDALLPQLADAGFPLGEGAPLKTAPRGRSADHPRIDLIRRTMLTVSHTFEPEPWFFDRELLDVVLEGFATIGRWNAWLAEHVGPSEKPLRAW